MQFLPGLFTLISGICISVVELAPTSNDPDLDQFEQMLFSSNLNAVEMEPFDPDIQFADPDDLMAQFEGILWDPDVVTEKEEPKKVEKDDEFEVPAGFDYDSMNLDYDNLGGEKKPEIKEEKANEDGDDDELIVNYDEMDL